LRPKIQNFQDGIKSELAFNQAEEKMGRPFYFTHFNSAQFIPRDVWNKAFEYEI
jgi:hypothetical protein